MILVLTYGQTDPQKECTCIYTSIWIQVRYCILFVSIEIKAQGITMEFQVTFIYKPNMKIFFLFNEEKSSNANYFRCDLGIDAREKF